MNATLRPRRAVSRKSKPAPTRPIPEVLLEIAYRLHATRPLPRPAACR
jgi:hypothetical protein